MRDNLQKKIVLILTIFCILTILAISLAAIRSPILGNLVFPYDSSKNSINIDFKFGVTARNELNTFDGTFTKDLIYDGTIKTRLILSQQELTQIKTKLLDMGFFDYPSSFQSQGIISPRDNYVLKVQIGSDIKEVSWYSDSNLDSKTDADLNELYNLVTGIINEKLEYKLLPAANGGYC
jgi:hypothetical protein